MSLQALEKYKCILLKARRCGTRYLLNVYFQSMCEIVKKRVSVRGESECMYEKLFIKLVQWFHKNHKIKFHFFHRVTIYDKNIEFLLIYR